MEKDLREQVKALNMDKIREEVVEWVQDPISNAGCLLAYDQIMVTYWVMKGILSHVLME